MTSHSSILAWEIPWTEEPGGLQSMTRKQNTTCVDQTNFPEGKAVLFE